MPQPSNLTFKHFYEDMSGVEYEFGLETSPVGDKFLVFKNGEDSVYIQYDMLEDVKQALDLISDLEE